MLFLIIYFFLMGYEPKKISIIKNNIEFKDGVYINNVFESGHSKTVLTSAPSLNVSLLRRCLR